jgi:hypothetical protein
LTLTTADGCKWSQETFKSVSSFLSLWNLWHTHKTLFLLVFLESISKKKNRCVEKVVNFCQTSFWPFQSLLS